MPATTRQPWVSSSRATAVTEFRSVRTWPYATMGVTSALGVYVIRFSVRRSLYAVLQKVLVESWVSWCSSVSSAVRSSPMASDAAAFTPREKIRDSARVSAAVLRKNSFIVCLQKVSGGKPVRPPAPPRLSAGFGLHNTSYKDNTSGGQSKCPIDYKILPVPPESSFTP